MYAGKRMYFLHAKMMQGRCKINEEEEEKEELRRKKEGDVQVEVSQ